MRQQLATTWHPSCVSVDTAARACKEEDHRHAFGSEIPSHARRRERGATPADSHCQHVRPNHHAKGYAEGRSEQETSRPLWLTPASLANSAALINSRPFEFELNKGVRARSNGSRRRANGTLEQYLVETWLAEIETQVKPTTLASTKTIVLRHIVPAIGCIRLNRLRREDLIAFYRDLLHKPAARRDHPLSKTTVQRIHATLHWALQDLVAVGGLNHNPAYNIRSKRRNFGRHEIRIWNETELCRFLTFARRDSLFPMWRLLAWTGMRRGEALGLKWSDLRARPNVVAIRRSLTIAGGRLHVTAPKSARARVVALDATTGRVLRSYRRRQDKLLVGEGLDPTGAEDWIFHVRRDPMNPSCVSKHFSRLVQRSGLPKIRLHDLRHTHASHLILAGANIKAVQERLGHADIVLTLNIYSHLLPTTQQEALSSLSRFYVEHT